MKPLEDRRALSREFIAGSWKCTFPTMNLLPMVDPSRVSHFISCLELKDGSFRPYVNFFLI